MIRTVDLRKTYWPGGEAVHALKGVNVSVSPGEIAAFVGPSGCGKSTLLHLIGGIDLPTQGEVCVNGSILSGLGEPERTRFRLMHIGIVFQRFFLLPYLTAAENVELPMAEAGKSKRERKERAAALFETLGIANRQRHKPWQLSGGEQQRVAIARALANDPAYVLADEPTGELDAANTKAIAAILKEVARRGKTVIVVTHNIELACEADRIIRLKDGRIEEPA